MGDPQGCSPATHPPWAGSAGLTGESSTRGKLLLCFLGVVRNTHGFSFIGGGVVGPCFALLEEL